MAERCRQYEIIQHRVAGEVLLSGGPASLRASIGTGGDSDDQTQLRHRIEALTAPAKATDPIDVLGIDR